MWDAPQELKLKPSNNCPPHTEPSHFTLPHGVMEIHDYSTKTQMLHSQTLEQRRWHPWLWWGGPHLGLYKLEYLVSKLGMAGCWCRVVLWRFQRWKPSLSLSEASLSTNFTTKMAPVSEGFWKKLALQLANVCWKTSAVKGNVRESDSLAHKRAVSVNQQINRQDVKLFSFKISIMTNFCPYRGSLTTPKLSLFLSALLI